MKGLCFAVLISLAAQEGLGFGLVFLARSHVEFKPGVYLLNPQGFWDFHCPWNVCGTFAWPGQGAQPC